MKRGEIWWADLPNGGLHPVVLISRDATYRIRTQATVALVTSRIRNIPVEVVVGQAEGLMHESAINVDNLATVELNVLTEKVGDLSEAQIRALDNALHFALGMQR